MLGSKEEKKISKADMEKKVEAYKTMYQVMVSTNAEFMSKLYGVLAEKEAGLNQLKEKLSTNEATEEENAQYIFQEGYIQCLKDILNAKKGV
jgi:hypothetical protein